MTDIHARTSAAFLADAASRCDRLNAMPADALACDAAIAAIEAGLVASGAIDAPDFPAFGRYVCDGDSVSIEVDGFTVTATVHHDDYSDAPWDREDGHGPVTEWLTRDKLPGERVLASDGQHKRFYDMAEATRIAKRDAWGPCIPYRTPGIVAAVAVEADFQAMRAWCNGDWAYCGIALTVEREGVTLTDQFAHALWGVEYNYPNSDNAYLAEVAGELLADALDDARAVLSRLAA